MTLIFTCSMNFMKEYKLERQYFQHLTYQKANDDITDTSSLDWKERLLILRYLNSIAYRLVNHPEPVFDRTLFSAGKLTEDEHLLP